MVVVAFSILCPAGPRPHATARPQQVEGLGHAAGKLLKSDSGKVARVQYYI